MSKCGDLFYYCDKCRKKYKTPERYTQHVTSAHNERDVSKLPRRKREKNKKKRTTTSATRGEGAKKEVARKKQKVVKSPPTVASTTVGGVTPECPICLEPRSNPGGVVIPCGHGSFCYACVAPLATCPICRAPAQSVNKLYV
jgi:rubrerythrin